MTYKQIERLNTKQTLALLGKCVARLYAEYEIPLLYAVVAATWTWALVTNF